MTGRNFGAFAGCRRTSGLLGMAQSQNAGANRGHRSQIEGLGVLDELQRIQHQAGCVDAAAVTAVAEATCKSEASVHGVATFYSLLNVRERVKPEPKNQTVLRMCDGPSCCLLGAEQLLGEESMTGDHAKVRTSCLGYCEFAPTAMIDEPGSPYQITSAGAGPTSTVFSTCCDGLKLLNHSHEDRRSLPLTGRFGVDPRTIDEAIKAGAYVTLARVLEMDRSDVIDQIEASGLRGRGGAGFNTGKKWRLASQANSELKFVVCNADESEPGTFKDRMLMENDPHQLLEGMAICAHAIGATAGIIYIRGEYANAENMLRHAIGEAKERGLLAIKNRGQNRHLEITIHRGAGAYACGEETALLASIEGQRGEPQHRPPFPTTDGLWGRPTVVNNVETLSGVPAIIRNGPDSFRQLGRSEEAGTKLFCLSGHIASPGLCEAPLGTPLGQIIEEFGAGMRCGSRFKFALTGGAAGTFVPASRLDVPMLYASWKHGVAIGSGAIMVADQSVSAARMLLWVLRFFERESCGKCPPCRIGTVQARQIVERIVLAGGSAGDIDRLLSLATTLESTSLCGLGESVAWPIESAINYFRSDFVASR